MLRGMIRAALLAATLALAACTEPADVTVYSLSVSSRGITLWPPDTYQVRGSQVIRWTAGKPTGVVGNICVIFAPDTWACPDVSMSQGHLGVAGDNGFVRQVTRGEWLMAGLPPISAPDAP